MTTNLNDVPADNYANYEYDDVIEWDNAFQRDYYDELVFGTMDGVRNLVSDVQISNPNEDVIVGSDIEFLEVSSNLSTPHKDEYNVGDAGLTIIIEGNISKLQPNKTFPRVMEMGGFGDNGWSIQYNLEDNIDLYYADGTGWVTNHRVPIHTDTICLITFVLKPDSTDIYVDGEFISTLVMTYSANNTRPLYIGYPANSGVIGKFNSYEIYSVAKDANWIKLDYEKRNRFW
jgi:hypothetical protein